MAKVVETLIWITGASSGIGAALAETMPLQHAQVFDVSRRGGGHGTTHIAADLSDPAAWVELERELVQQLKDFAGDRAIFIHNAGTLDPMGFAGEVDSAAYQRNVLLNSAAPQVIGQAFLKATAKFEGRAQLVMLSSGAARKPYTGWSSYSAGKAALEMWVRAAGEEQQVRADRGKHHVQIMAVAPGVVATPMQEQIRATSARKFPSVKRFVGLHEDGELVDPHDAARGIWDVIEQRWPTGSCVDLRKL